MENVLIEKVKNIFNKPLIDLVLEAMNIHKNNHDHTKIQISTLVNIKSGACAEDCGYCSQSARYDSGLEPEELKKWEEIKAQIKIAKINGSSRICLGAAWRNVEEGKDFDEILRMVKEINDEGLEVCATLGMLTEKQAKLLEKAGLYYYNHNIDTSKEYYKEVISTRTFDDRIKTIDNVKKTKIKVCAGGIIGLGETEKDRISMLHTLANLNPPPHSIPINALVPVEGTPIGEEKYELVSVWEMIRMIATTRIIMPKSQIRLSAGRKEISQEGQLLCFLVGANSIFAGSKLLTTPNPDIKEDMDFFKILGIHPAKPFSEGEKPKGEIVYSDTTNKEKIKWERPSHIIERNIKYSKKEKLKILK